MKKNIKKCKIHILNLYKMQRQKKVFFEAETKFNILIADVNKIIGEAISDVI